MIVLLWLGSLNTVQLFSGQFKVRDNVRVNVHSEDLSIMLIGFEDREIYWFFLLMTSVFFILLYAYRALMMKYLLNGTWNRNLRKRGENGKKTIPALKVYTVNQFCTLPFLIRLQSTLWYFVCHWLCFQVKSWWSYVQ